MKFRSERERVIVQLGAFVAMVLLYVGLVLQPLLRRISQDEKALPAGQATLERAQRLAGTLVFLKATQGKKRTGSLAQEVDRITRELGLQQGKQVTDLKDLGNNAVQLRLEDLDGPTLVRLLNSMEKSGIRTDGFKMRDPKGRGLWIVNLTVKGANP